jgi:uncharacterized protein YraI
MYNKAYHTRFIHMKRWSFFLFVFAVLIGVLPTAAQSGGLWTAEYFANPNLTGAPTLTLSENTPSHDWGTGSPGAGISPDFFSARWTSVQTLSAGLYQLTVRADDGVLVFIDNVVYVNEWHPSPGQTYTTTLNLGAGQHTFRVEFYEGGGNAFLQFTFVQILSTPIPSSATATVNTGMLNVRNAPNPFATILTRISWGQTYGVVGRNASTSWLQLNVNGTIGWVNASYTIASNLQNVPVTDGGGSNVCPGNLPSRLVVGGQGRVLPGLPNNLRANPSTGSAWIGVIPAGGVFAVLSGPQCGENIIWWQVNYNGTVAWTGEGQGNNYWVEPATGSTGATATVTAYYLNVRNAPNAFATILTRISRWQNYSVVGRNGNNSWLQLNVNGTIGWVNARYVSASNLGGVPVTG